MTVRGLHPQPMRGTETMNFFDQLRIRLAASADRRASVDSLELRIEEVLGRRPTFDPVGNHLHRVMSTALNNRVDVEELEDDIRRLEDELSAYPSVLALSLGLVAALVGETLGAILVMKSLGVEGPERTVLGGLLSVAIVGGTAFVSRIVAPEEAAARSMLRAFAGLILVVLYALFVLALAVVRVHELADGETVGLVTYAQAVIMAVTTILPALGAEWLSRRRSPARRIQKQLRVLRRRLALAVRAHAHAEQFVTKLARDAERYDHEATKLRALYRVNHRLAAVEPKEQPE